MRQEPVYTEEYKGFTINLYVDDDPRDPRLENENFGHMVCFHRRYQLGDKHRYSIPHDFLESLGDESKYLILNLYLYDHSGITMSTSPFSCPWDSGQVGYIYCSRAEAVKEFGRKICSKAVKKKALDCMRSEVEEYSAYLEGNVYGYQVVDPDGEEVDSCWGFIEPGPLCKSYCLEEAKDTANYYAGLRDKEREEEKYRESLSWVTAA